MIGIRLRPHLRRELAHAFSAPFRLQSGVGNRGSQQKPLRMRMVALVAAFLAPGISLVVYMGIALTIAAS